MTFVVCPVVVEIVGVDLGCWWSLSFLVERCARYLLCSATSVFGPPQALPQTASSEKHDVGGTEIRNDGSSEAMGNLPISGEKALDLWTGIFRKGAFVEVVPGLLVGSTRQGRRWGTG